MTSIVLNELERRKGRYALQATVVLADWAQLTLIERLFLTTCPD